MFFFPVEVSRERIEERTTLFTVFVLAEAKKGGLGVTNSELCNLCYEPYVHLSLGLTH